MNIIQEKVKSYTNLSDLKKDLTSKPVRETLAFPLKEMELTQDGIIALGNLYHLNEASLKDALTRGGFLPSTYNNYLDELSPEVHEGLIYATNKFYQKSAYRDNLVKLVTRKELDGTETVLGIPSHKYTLFTHNQLVDQISDTINCNGDLKIKRCIHYPEYLELAFTSPKKAVKDNVGEIVQTGVKFVNSEGTRTRCLTMSAFSFRLVCSNGATARHDDFMKSYVHKGNMNHLRIGDEMTTITDRFYVLMEKLPQLGDIPITQKIVEKLKKPLLDALGKPYYMDIKQELQQYRTLDEVWNKITNIPQDSSYKLNAERKLKLEQIGFDILVDNLV